MKIKKYLIGFLLLPIMLNGQNTATDSLSLSDILGNVMNNYPLLKKAEKEIVAADAKIGLTKTAYLPNVDFSSSFTHLGPTTTISMPIGATVRNLQLFPENMYNATFSVNENIYDFGKTIKNIVLDEKNKKMVQLSMDQTKQRLSMAILGIYYSVSFLQEAISIKEEQLKTLTEHLNFVQKKASSGSATKYDILTTNVRISALENVKTDLESALLVQNGQLNAYLGKPLNSAVVLKKTLQPALILAPVDSLCATALANRNEMKMARQKEEISKSRLDIIKVQNNPSINAFASGGFKNGYLDASLQDVGKFNYAVGVGLKIPVFDADRSKYIKIQANADLEGIQEETELARRNITNEVLECRAGAESALKKVKQSQLQLQQALQAYDLAEINYKTGVITNLDLLDNYSALSESKLSVFKTKLDYSASILKLKIALGEKLY